MKEFKFVDVESLNLDAIEDLPSLILDSEQEYTKQVAEIAKVICNNANLKIILLAGPSASGKTTTSNILKLNLEMLGKKVVTVSLDDFFLPRDKTPKLPDGSYDFESIDALNLPRLNQFIDELIENGVSKMPKFNFLTGNPDDNAIEITADSNTIIIFEGLHALNPKIIKHNKDKVFKIYINLYTNYIYNNELCLKYDDIRFLRRLTRDFYTRGSSAQHTFKMWENVLNGEVKYITPFKDKADFVINSSHSYEVLVYANYTKKLLIDSIRPDFDEQMNETFKNLLNALDKFEPINKDLIPTTSLLWEFISLA